MSKYKIDTTGLLGAIKEAKENANTVYSKVEEVFIMYLISQQID
ncbi:hypothetical protein [Romboutsia sp.]